MNVEQLIPEGPILVSSSAYCDRENISWLGILNVYKNLLNNLCRDSENKSSYLWNLVVQSYAQLAIQHLIKAMVMLIKAL